MVPSEQTQASANRIIKSCLVACNHNADLFIVNCLEHFRITYTSKEGIPPRFLATICPGAVFDVRNLGLPHQKALKKQGELIPTTSTNVH